MLPSILLSLTFFLLTWWLFYRGWKWWSVIPAIVGLVLLSFTIAVKLQDVNKVQARYDVDILLRELPSPDLWQKDDLRNNDERLFLAATAAEALSRARTYAPERAGAIDSTFLLLAEWVADRRNFPQWRNRRQWDREAFFLAHATTVLAHYQLATKDGDTFGTLLRDAGTHLGNRLQRGRYKHLVSRPEEDFFRPADNAAVLYALSLYDRLHGSDYLRPNFEDWSNYLKEELYFAESRLPCAAFSTTNRCQLEPNATATGLYVAYRTAADPATTPDDIPWLEWQHYFKKGSFSPLSLSIRPNMRSGETARLCTQGAAPLNCDYYENAIGLWAAAENEGHYTYFRLFATEVLRRWLRPAPDFAASSPARRTRMLTRVALRGIGEGR